MATIAAEASAPSAPAVAPVPTKKICGGGTVRDFLSPLKKMPRQPNAGPGGKLSFGPSRIRLQPSPALVVDGGTAGVSLSLADDGPAAHPRWDVLTMLWKVNRRGSPIEPIDFSLRRVRKVDNSGVGIEFEVAADPAFYLVTTSFRAPSSGAHGRHQLGRRLGEFGYYFRVVRPGRDARLELSAPVYAPGSTVQFRVGNYGTTRVNYGVNYRIERLEGDTWVEAPESPDGPWIRLLLSSGAGQAGRCLQFPTPPTMPLGQYRVVKPISGQPAITAEFLVAVS